MTNAETDRRPSELIAATSQLRVISAETVRKRAAFNNLQLVSPEQTELEKRYNFDEVLNMLISEEQPQITIINFKAVRFPDADLGTLNTLDEKAQEETNGSDDFFGYKFQPMEVDNLMSESLCAWRSADAARSVSRLPHHQAAVRFAPFAYEGGEVFRYSASVKNGESRFVLEDRNAFGNKRTA